MMAGKSVFFAGGGTGGHIYPALAVAEKIAELDTTAKIYFFISARDIDKHVLSKTSFEYTALPALGLLNQAGQIFQFLQNVPVEL